MKIPRMTLPAHLLRWPIAFLTALLVVGGVVTPTPQKAAAAPPAADFDFYRPPSPLQKGAPGKLIRYAEANTALGLGAPAAKAWTVMYHSRNVRQQDVAVTGTVLTPTTSWTGGGPRPFVILTVGTQGLGQDCSPSRQIVAGTLNEAGKITKALQNNWGVIVTDYAGYTKDATPSYLVGQDMAYAALDAARTARQLPESGITPETPFVIWGYSQGGRASGWATSVQPTYAPELKVLADASGGIPSDLNALIQFLNGGAGASFALAALVGLEQAYPAEVPLTQSLNEEGLAAVASIKQLCRDDMLPAFALRNLDSYFKPGLSLTQFLQQPSVTTVLDQNQLQRQTAPKVPVLQYHGLADEVVPVTQGIDLHKSWCARGVTTRLDMYPGEHVTADNSAEAVAAQWLKDVLSGAPVAGQCLL
jgi:pimeloyl-ACP methyl ester carboxylesterase